MDKKIRPAMNLSTYSSPLFPRKVIAARFRWDATKKSGESASRLTCRGYRRRKW